MNISLSYRECWRKHPALFYGIASLISTGATLQWKPVFLFLIIGLVVPFFIQPLRRDFVRLFIAIALGVTCCFYVHMTYQFPDFIEKNESDGTALLTIDSIRKQPSAFGEKWSYQGTIELFCSPEGDRIGRHLPFTLYLAAKDNRNGPLANCQYLVNCRLIEVETCKYQLKVSPLASWKFVKNRWGLAEKRFYAKQWTEQYISTKIKSHKASHFLIGMITGEFSDRMMAYDFRRFGLQHIMAISGFHFAILATILGCFLRLLFNIQITKLLLISLLSFYFLFLGFSASIFRAWMMILLSLSGSLLSKKPRSLNSLGIALMMILFIDPLASRQLGFQLSFASTAAILLLYHTYDHLLRVPFNKRRLSEMVQMNTWEQHGYCILSFFRQAAALSLSVNSVAIPLLLFYFNEFPFMSLVYNLFFPFLVSLSLFFLLVGLLVEWIWPTLGQFFYWFSTFLTESLLTLTHDTPLEWDIIWRNDLLNINSLIFIVFVVFSFGIIFSYEKQNNDNLIFV